LTVISVNLRPSLTNKRLRAGLDRTLFAPLEAELLPVGVDDPILGEVAASRRLSKKTTRDAWWKL
jgi:hypothetical protein